MFWGFRVAYLMILFLSTFGSFFFSNSLSIWLMLELNFMSFVSILSQELSIINSNGNLYYFLVQGLGSALMLLSLLVFLVWDIKVFKMIFVFAIMLKLGSAPFQFWYLKLIQKISWSNIWLLSIWQKLIPLMLVKFCPLNFLMIFSATSIIISSVSSLKQKKVKKILGLSSLFSLGWVLAIIGISKVWLWFMIGYGMALLNLIHGLKKKFLQNTMTLENSTNNPSGLLLFFLGLLMVSGIPPFMVFFLKVLILSILAKFSYLLMLLFLSLSIFMIYIYLMMGFSFLSFLKLKEVSSSVALNNKFEVSYILLQNLVFALVLVAFM